MRQRWPPNKIDALGANVADAAAGLEERDQLLTEVQNLKAERGRLLEEKKRSDANLPRLLEEAGDVDFNEVGEYYINSRWKAWSRRPTRMVS